MQTNYVHRNAEGPAQLRSWRRGLSETCFTEISSNLPEKKLELKYGKGRFKETAGRVCFQGIFFRSKLIYSGGKAG